jgi:hypothetical protein
MGKHRKISTRFLIILFAALFLASVAAAFLSLSGEQGAFAHVSVEGSLLKIIDLEAVEEAYLMEISPGNVLLVERGAVAMYSADCPDQLCVKQGKAGEGGLPIICLPGRIMVEIKSSEGDEWKTVDAVSGR